MPGDGLVGGVPGEPGFGGVPGEEGVPGFGGVPLLIISSLVLEGGVQGDQKCETRRRISPAGWQ